MERIIRKVKECAFILKLIINGEFDKYMSIDEMLEDYYDGLEADKRKHDERMPLECFLKLIENLDKLYEFQDLGDNWNGNGAASFEVDLLEKVRRILPELSQQPSVFPTGRQSIQLEYGKHNGEYLEFEVYKDKITYLLIKNDDEIEGEVSETALNSLINDFCNKCETTVVN